MAEYHVGCGILGIYAGVLNKNGDLWQRKSEVTNEALDAVANYLIINEKEFRFTYQGKRYAMRITRMDK